MIVVVVIVQWELPLHLEPSLDFKSCLLEGPHVDRDHDTHGVRVAMQILLATNKQSIRMCMMARKHCSTVYRVLVRPSVPRAQLEVLAKYSPEGSKSWKH